MTDNQLVVSGQDKVISFLAGEQIAANTATINRLIILEREIEQLTREEDELTKQLNLVRYRKGEVISEFRESIPKGYWTRWLIFKLFGRLASPDELNSGEKRRLGKVQTTLDNYRVLYNAINYSLAIHSAYEKRQISIEEFLEETAFADLSAAIWYRLGRNIEQLEEGFYKIIHDHVNAGNQISVNEIKQFRMIAASKEIAPDDKIAQIKEILNKPLNKVPPTKTSKPTNDLTGQEPDVIDVEFTSSKVSGNTSANANTTNTNPEARSETATTAATSKVPNTINNPTVRKIELPINTDETLVTAPSEAQTIAVLKQEIEKLLTKNQKLADELRQKEIIIEQLHQDIKDLEFDQYELRQKIMELEGATVENKFRDKTNTELLAIAQKPLTSEEDLQAIGIKLGLNISSLKIGKLRKEIVTKLTQLIREESEFS